MASPPRPNRYAVLMRGRLLRLIAVLYDHGGELQAWKLSRYGGNGAMARAVRDATHHGLVEKMPDGRLVLTSRGYALAEKIEELLRVAEQLSIT